MKSNIKGLLGLLSIVALAAAVSILAGCAPAGKSISDVLKDFTYAVNDRDTGDIRDCLDSDATSYTMAATMAFWDALLPQANAPFSISISSKSSSSATAVLSGSSGFTVTWYFEMSEEKGTMFEGGTYYIRRIRENNGSGTVIFQ